MYYPAETRQVPNWKMEEEFGVLSRRGKGEEMDVYTVHERVSFQLYFFLMTNILYYFLNIVSCIRECFPLQ